MIAPARSLVRILVVENSTSLRESMEKELKPEEGIQVLPGCRDGTEALREAPKLGPDVVFINAVLPDLDGPEVARSLRPLLPHCRFVLLSGYKCNEMVIEFLKTGGSGFVDRSAPSLNLAAVIKRVMEGSIYLSVETCRQLHEGFESEELDRLSPVEREILKGTAAGQNPARLASALKLTPQAVGSGRTRVMRKLGLAGEAHLVLYAVRSGLVSGLES